MAFAVGGGPLLPPLHDGAGPIALARAALAPGLLAAAERKHVTVLFADITDSLRIIAGRDPEVAGQIFAPVIEGLKQSVNAFQGTVTSIRGDGIVALFGAPIGLEAHAVNACHAALAIQADRRASRQLSSRFGIDLAIRVGLNSGEVVVRPLRNDVSTDYDATGTAVHIASRMEELAIPGTVRIASPTQRLVADHFETRLVGAMPIKGLVHPLDVYELVRARRRRSRIQIGKAGGLSPFIGRERELAVLREAIEAADAGSGRVVAVVGQPGCGKSRLLFEFLSTADTGRCRVLEARAQSYEKDTLYAGVRDLLRDYFKLGESDDGGAVSSRIGNVLRALDPDLAQSAPAIGAMFDEAAPDPRWNDLDPLERRRRISDAVVRLILRESERQPVVLVLEDLQWVDDGTEGIIGRLIEQAADKRLLVVMNHRPEYEHAWCDRRWYRELRLDALSSEESTRLLDELLIRGPGTNDLADLLIRQTDGNPLFLEECLRALAEEGVLVAEAGRYRLSGSAEAVSIPANVQAVLSARIDRLPAEQKKVLQAAAVIGNDVDPAILSEIVDGVPSFRLREAILELKSAEFLRDAADQHELSFTFRHALTQEVAYRTQVGDRRRMLHARIVEAMERLYPARLGEQAETLAYHSRLGGVWGKAVRYGREAGAKSAARSANREARKFFEQSLAALGDMPLDDARRKLSVDIRLELRDVLFQLGEHPAVLTHLREAEETAESLDDKPRLALTRVCLGHVFWLTGRHRQAAVAIEQALAISRELGDANLQVRSRFQRGLIHLACGEYAKAAEDVRDTYRHHCDVGRANVYGLGEALAITALGYQVRALAETGEFAAAEQAGADALALSGEDGNMFAEIFVRLGLGYMHCVRGYPHKAVPHLDTAVRLSTAAEALLMDPVAKAFLGSAYVRSGDPLRGLPLLEAAAVAGEHVGALFQHPLRLALLSEGLLVAGRTREAAKQASHALRLAVEQGERGQEAYARHVLAAVEAGDGSVSGLERASEHGRCALAIATSLGMRPLVAACLAANGEVESRRGDREAAEKAFADASTLFAELEMDPDGLPLLRCRPYGSGVSMSARRP